MAYDDVAWASRQKLPTHEKFILMMLACRRNGETGETFPKQSTLAADTGICERSVRAALKNLEKLGFIERQASYRKSGHRGADRYELNHLRPIDYRHVVPVVYRHVVPGFNKEAPNKVFIHENESKGNTSPRIIDGRELNRAGGSL